MAKSTEEILRRKDERQYTHSRQMNMMVNVEIVVR